MEGSLGSMGIKLSKIIQNYRFDLRTSTQYFCMNPLSKQFFFVIPHWGAFFLSQQARIFHKEGASFLSAPRLIDAAHFSSVSWLSRLHTTHTAARIV